MSVKTVSEPYRTLAYFKHLTLMGNVLVVLVQNVMDK